MLLIESWKTQWKEKKKSQWNFCLLNKPAEENKLFSIAGHCIHWWKFVSVNILKNPNPLKLIRAILPKYTS